MSALLPKEKIHEFLGKDTPKKMAYLLNPVIAGAAMAFSSVSVVTNALLMKRYRPKIKG